MLGKLFGSNSRVKLLKIFLLHPANKYYIRQLARELKLQINSVRRELENLEEFGLLMSSLGINEGENADDAFTEGFIEKEAEEAKKQENIKASKQKNKKTKKQTSAKINNQEKKYYQINIDFPLIDEIKSLIVSAQLLYKDELIEKIKRTGNVKLLILTGIFTNNPKAEVDVLVVGKIDKDKLKRAIKALENELGREVNYTSMDSREFRYRRDMTDVFLYGVLEGKILVAVDEVGLR